MLNAVDSTTSSPSLPAIAAGHIAACRSDDNESRRARERIAETLHMLEHEMSPQRRLVHAGDRVYQAGERFGNLYIVNSGVYKIVTLSPDGREQVVGFKFRGDWLGFDGIADNQHSCDVIAMDTGEIWVLGYEQLVRACDRQPQLLQSLLQAMSREMAHDRDSLMSVCTLPADARVADFLGYWADSHARCGMRSDQITLRLTRAEIGNYLGMTLESVSRALSKLERHEVIHFGDKGRREIHIRDVRALSTFAQNHVAGSGALH